MHDGLYAGAPIAFAQATQAFVCVHPDQNPLKVAFYGSGLDIGNLHSWFLLLMY
jgi:hypothetical protein